MRYISFSQSSGEISVHDDGIDYLIGIGWAGNGAGKLNPDMQAVQGVGPLPQGWYNIGAPFTHPTCGPFALRLTPHTETEMFGRDGFLIHGAAQNLEHYGQESKGCIVAVRAVREKVHSLGITLLQVTG